MNISNKQMKELLNYNNKIKQKISDMVTKYNDNNYLNKIHSRRILTKNIKKKYCSNKHKRQALIKYLFFIKLFIKTIIYN